jgi:hypothetical protein
MEQKKIKDMSPDETKAYARFRKQKQRTREKKEREQYEVDLDNRERAEVYRALNLHYFGEETPGIDTSTHDSELAIHREFLRAMNQPDVQPGETLRRIAERTWKAWNDVVTSWLCVDGEKKIPLKSPGFPLAFNRTTQKFDGFHGFDTTKYLSVPFDEIWTAPRGGGETPIDIAALPPLKPVRSAVEPKVEAQAEVNKWRNK